MNIFAKFFEIKKLLHDPMLSVGVTHAPGDQRVEADITLLLLPPVIDPEIKLPLPAIQCSIVS
jgi:hypothetical protein